MNLNSINLVSGILCLLSFLLVVSENSDDSFKDYSKVESNEVLHRKYQPTQVFLSN